MHPTARPGCHREGAPTQAGSLHRSILSCCTGAASLRSHDWIDLRIPTSKLNSGPSSSSFNTSRRSPAASVRMSPVTTLRVGRTGRGSRAPSAARGVAVFPRLDRSIYSGGGRHLRSPDPIMGRQTTGGVTLVLLRSVPLGFDKHAELHLHGNTGILLRSDQTCIRVLLQFDTCIMIARTLSITNKQEACTEAMQVIKYLIYLAHASLYVYEFKTDSLTT